MPTPRTAALVERAGIALLVVSSVLGAAGYFWTILGFAAVGVAAVAVMMLAVARRVERRARVREGDPVRR